MDESQATTNIEMVPCPIIDEICDHPETCDCNTCPKIKEAKKCTNTN